MQLGRLRALAAAAAGTLIWAGSAHAATTDFATSFEATDPPPTWISTAERASGVTGPAPTGIPGNVTDTVVGRPRQRREHRRRRGQGEPRRRRRRDASGSYSRATGWVEFELAEPVAVVALRAHLGQRRREPRPARLDAAGLPGRRAPGRRSTPRPARPSPSASRRRSTASPTTTAYRHYRLDITRNNGDGIAAARRVAALRRRARRRRPVGDMRTAVGRRPARRLNAKAGAGFTGAQGAAIRRQHTAGRPRLLLQQGLRRRHPRHAARPSCPT